MENKSVEIIYDEGSAETFKNVQSVSIAQKFMTLRFKENENVYINIDKTYKIAMKGL